MAQFGEVESNLMFGKNHKYLLLIMTDNATLHSTLKILTDKQNEDLKKGHGGNVEKLIISFINHNF